MFCFISVSHYAYSTQNVQTYVLNVNILLGLNRSTQIIVWTLAPESM